MSDPTGSLVVSADGEDYTLHLGFSVLAKLHSKHGESVKKLLNGNPEWAEDLAFILDLFLGCLERHHAGAVDAYTVDAIMQQNPDVLGRLFGASMPSAEGNAPTGKPRKK